MLKIMRDRWATNENALKEAIAKIKKINYDLQYKDLVKLTFEEIFNRGDETWGYSHTVDTKHITEIDDGDYQGTLIYLIPIDCYQPCENDYLMTYIGYGSCSGCDLLQHILDDFPSREEQNKRLLYLCKDIVANTIKPYQYGWRYDDRYSVVEVDQNA